MIAYYRDVWCRLAVCAALICLAGCKKPARHDERPPEGDWRALYDAWRDPDPIPSFELTDQRGDRFRLGELAPGAHVLVGFIYTRCPLPEACPLTTERMRDVQEAWRARKAAADVGNRDLVLLSVTFDPDHDTPDVLAQYASDRHVDVASWTFATGPSELVTTALPSLFNVLAIPGAGMDISHTVKIALLRPDLTLLAEWGDNHVDAADVVDLVLSSDP